MIADPAQRPPLRFALLAVLLVLPALGLAALALRALALDRRAADAEAAARAQDVAAAIAVRLTNVIHDARPVPEDETGGWTFGPNIAWLKLDKGGHLVWPRLGAWPPVPAPLPRGLPTDLQTLWDAAEAALNTRQGSNAAALLLQFAEQAESLPPPGPPARHLPNALLRHAAALEMAGEKASAQTAYHKAFQAALEAAGDGSQLTEAGSPIVLLAALRLLELAGHDTAGLPAEWRQQPEDFLGRVADQPFTPLHDLIWARVEPLLSDLAVIRLWTATNSPALRMPRPGISVSNLAEPFRRREFARRAYAALAGARAQPWPDAMHLHQDREAWLALRQRLVMPGTEPAPEPHADAEMARHFSLFRWATLFDEARAAAKVVDPRGVFGIAVTAAGAGFNVAQEEPAGVMARAAATAEARLPQGLIITVAAAPVDAEAFFATQRRRERTFGAVVLGAVAVSLAAAAATWVMLARQHRLGVEKSNLVAAVSHELRAPLASVRLLADNLAQGRVPDDARRGEALRLIGRECRRLGALVDNVLDLARIARGRRRYEFGPTDVGALVRETVASLAPAAAERGVRLRADFAPGAETLEAMVDGRALQQALLNLLDNALKHAPAGSEVRVDVAATPPSPRGPAAPRREEQGNGELEMGNGAGEGASQPRGGFTITVTDAGPGIPAADRERVFEPFHRVGGELRRETTGVGIGLAIVRHIVAAHGGRVWIEEAAPRGTRVVVEIP